MFKNISSYFEAGIRFKHVTIAGYYEQMKFSKSNTADVGQDVIVGQPEPDSFLVPFAPC